MSRDVQHDPSSGNKDKVPVATLFYFGPRVRRSLHQSILHSVGGERREQRHEAGLASFLHRIAVQYMFVYSWANWRGTEHFWEASCLFVGRCVGLSIIK